jgi:membrane-associated phospholipid phosphatase
VRDAHPTNCCAAHTLRVLRPFQLRPANYRSPFSALCVCLALGAPVAMAQAPALPKRLSAWLLEQPPSPDPYYLGVSWRVVDEVPAQSALRLELLNVLAQREMGADAASARRLRTWLAGLPVTGRVRLAVTDPRWLQANPARDPILFPGHTAVLPQRPRTVTVVASNGEPCRITHRAGHEAAAYVRACSAAGAAGVDWAYVAQPDGRVQRYGIAAWNREEQDEPAPGAWIWAPPRDAGWPEDFSEKLVRFLATQGPAPDEVPSHPTPPHPVPPHPVPPHPNPLPQAGGEGTVGSGGEGTVGSGGEGGSRSRGLRITASDWGHVGLMQTPTARLLDAGHFVFNYSRIDPYSHGNVFTTPFDWLEAGFRYTDISNRLYGPPELSGGQSAKDKGLDVKFRLLTESAYRPQVALGFRDIGGTGLFSGEYLVASKRTGDFDWSLGVGWGYLAGQSRTISGQGGNFNFGNYFSGSPKLFGGVQWHTPWDPLTVKLEYDANNYQSEPQNNTQSQRTPWNLGFVYRAARWVDVTLGIERGNTAMLGVTLYTPLDKLTVPKLSDPPRVQVAGARPQKPPDWSVTANEVARQTGWHVRSIAQRGNEVRVAFDEPGGAYWRSRVDKAAAVLHRDAPQPVDRFVFVYHERGTAMAEHVVDRNTWFLQQVQPVTPANEREIVIARSPEAGDAGKVVFEGRPKAFDGNVGLDFIQTLGGPDAFLLYQIYAKGNGRLRLRDDTWLQGELRWRLIDNYERFKFTGPSNLPRVRTFQREYLTASEVTMSNLQLTHVGKLSANHYYSVYGGYLEEMFAGVGGEWLYRPFASRVAFGVDVNAVRQREFEQKFGFLDPTYDVVTGHATLYWDTGWNDVEVRLSAGRYLARDLGVTLEMSRMFRNGVKLGAFVTRTNVSAEEFGEGSFDKGVFISIPFDAIFTRSSSSLASFTWRPLTRDGGAKLRRGTALYDVTQARDDRTLRREPAPPPNDTIMPGDRREAWQPQAKGVEPYTRVTPRPAEAQWARGEVYEHRLVEALYRQEFRNVSVAYDTSHRLALTVSNERLSPVSLAVGRAARTALRLAPLDAREIRITFADRTGPLVTYEFFDLARLERYFEGAIGQAELAEYVAVRYVNPAARERDPLARLGDAEPAAETFSVARSFPETRAFSRVAGDFAEAARFATGVDWVKAGLVGTGITLASAALDNRAYRFARDHAGNSGLRALGTAADVVPWLGLAGAAIFALDGSDPIRQRTGFAALEAGATGFIAATGLKYGFGRARPDTGAGNRSFRPGSSDDAHHSLPSRHSTVAWAIATPFALEYGWNWLYGVAALTNLGRIGDREHWVSDTVAGSLLGYGIGRIFWEAGRARGKNSPHVFLTPSGVNLAWELP